MKEPEKTHIQHCMLILTNIQKVIHLKAIKKEGAMPRTTPIKVVGAISMIIIPEKQDQVVLSDCLQIL